MLTRIEEYIKDRLEKVMFIELRKDAHLSENKFEILKEIPIPIPMNELVKPIQEGTTDYNFSLASMARGMIMIIGLDHQFKYIKEYKEFLYAFDEKILEYMAYEGLKFAEEEKFYNALIYFKAIVTLKDADLNGLYNYARICEDIAKKQEDESIKKEFNKEGVEALEIITEKYPDFSLSYYHLGFHYVQDKTFKKAEITWEKFLELEGDEEKRKEILINLKEIKDQIQYEEGYTLILENKASLGLEKLTPLVERYGDWWNLLFFMGLGYRQIGEVHKSIEYFKKILTLKPTQVDTLNELGLCYAMIRDFTKSEKYFKKALQFKSQDNEILCNLGMLYMEIGKIDEAEDIFHQSMEINPHDSITKECIKQLNHIKEKHLK
ncbi:tetratricopeptide repeat protein [Inediibacterium massiliense]|uniref:tetratricopeptide repeat protein n=1 Tax=Inediibacterium massiliense TaxID=1658111 RepID=UPI0006B61835|nr:tetratricopeptide repeat protein [Inediibacterium massiliense]